MTTWGVFIRCKLPPAILAMHKNVMPVPASEDGQHMGPTAGLSSAAEPRAVRRKMTWFSSSPANSVPNARTAVDRLAWRAPAVGFLALPRYLLGTPDPCATRRAKCSLRSAGSHRGARCKDHRDVPPSPAPQTA